MLSTCGAKLDEQVEAQDEDREREGGRKALQGNGGVELKRKTSRSRTPVETQ